MQPVESRHTKICFREVDAGGVRRCGVRDALPGEAAAEVGPGLEKVIVEIFRPGNRDLFGRLCGLDRKHRQRQHASGRKVGIIAGHWVRVIAADDELIRNHATDVRDDGKGHRS